MREKAVMSTTQRVDSKHLTAALYTLLDETFDEVHGAYLDRGTSLFETLATISAEEASIPIGGRCATLAAQVSHITYYLEVVVQSARNRNLPPADWDEIWRTVAEVDEEAWHTIKGDLRATHQSVKHLIAETPAWESDRQIGGAIAIIAHTAYHLGEVRQALCTLR